MHSSVIKHQSDCNSRLSAVWSQARRHGYVHDKCSVQKSHIFDGVNVLRTSRRCKQFWGSDTVHIMFHSNPKTSNYFTCIFDSFYLGVLFCIIKNICFRNKKCVMFQCCLQTACFHRSFTSFYQIADIYVNFTVIMNHDS